MFLLNVDRNQRFYKRCVDGSTVCTHSLSTSTLHSLVSFHRRVYILCLNSNRTPDPLPAPASGRSLSCGHRCFVACSTHVFTLVGTPIAMAKHYASSPLDLRSFSASSVVLDPAGTQSYTPSQRNCTYTMPAGSIQNRIKICLPLPSPNSIYTTYINVTKCVKSEKYTT